MPRRVPTAALLVAALALAGCGKAVFEPDCRVPARGDRARPIALAELGPDRFAAVHADTDETFCGGFLTVHDATGREVADPVLVPVPEGYEANFNSAATTATHLWLAGRRHGHVVGLDRATLEVAVRRSGNQAQRVLEAGPNRVVAWVPRERQTPPRLLWFDDAGAARGETELEFATVAAGHYDPARRRLWLAYVGGNNLAYVELGNVASVERAFPLGVGTTYNLRGIAPETGGASLWAADFSKGLLVRFGAADGTPLAAEPVGRQPERMGHDRYGRPWVMDGTGRIFARIGERWLRIGANAQRPVALLDTGQAMLVADYGAEAVTAVTVPAP